MTQTNTKTAALVGVFLIVLGILSNPQAQSAIVTLLTHPSAPQLVSAIGIIAGVISLYVAKPYFIK